MAGKKKKPAANPARGFATTSVASKPKPEATSSVEPSGVNTPDTNATMPAAKDDDTTNTSSAQPERELHELSPEELEAQLEASELQQFVEQYAAKVRKENLLARAMKRIEARQQGMSVIRSQRASGLSAMGSDEVSGFFFFSCSPFIVLMTA